MTRYNNILETIGNTPLVRLNKLAPEGVNLYVKLEAFNPLSSVKDRMARAVIEKAERSGELKPGQTVVEATSGNTGIGLAMVCAQKGYPLVIVMAENFSLERRKLLRFLGAKVVLTPASEKGTGMVNKAIELAEQHGWYLPRQFENEMNAEVHTLTTAQEILKDFEGEHLDAFVCGFGTGGTLLGVARGLKAADPSIRIVAAEPDNAPVLGSGIKQQRGPDGAPLGSHPYFRPHLFQGWAPDFVSKLTETAQEEHLVDEIVPVSGQESLRLARALATQEGIFVGITSGGALMAALDLAKRSAPGTNIVCLLADTGERYMTTPLFEEINTDMNADEIDISRSTPGYRFDLAPQCPTPAPAPQTAPQPVQVDREATKFVERVIKTEPVVLFALEWCEFCWAVRKLFSRLNIPFLSVDLDSVAYQKDDMGLKLRAAVGARVGSPTIPQIFINGEHIGGCSELFDEVQNGTLWQKLSDAGFNTKPMSQEESRAFLPAWVHPRQVA